MRSISEAVAYLVLLGALAVASAIALTIVPRFFQAYSHVAAEVAHSLHLPGYATAASLTRVELPGSDYTALTVIIYNGGSTPVKVSYTITCNGRYIGGERDITIPAHKVYHKVYKVRGETVEGKTCHLTVEEPNLLVYRVVES